MPFIDRFLHDKNCDNHLRFDNDWGLHHEFDEEDTLDLKRYGNREEFDADPWDEDSWSDEGI